MPPLLKFIKKTSIFFIALTLFGLAKTSWAEIWVDVDTEAATLSVRDGTKTLLTFDNIAHGRAGVTDLHILNDNKTPRGVFKIVRINRQSQYRTFFEFNYPTMKHAKVALDQNIIDEQTYERIALSQRRGVRTPSDTPLGGLLGIHGIGRGSQEFHTKFNWTHGCIAVTNAQIDELAKWIGMGTTVVVH